MHPRLFTFGNITLPTYGAFIALAVMAALLLAMALAKRMQLDRDRIWMLGLLAVFSAIVGSKLMAVFANWSSFIASPRLLLSLPALQSQGIAWGGILLAVIVCAAYLVFARLPLLRTLDVGAPALALGQGIAGIGSLMAGSAYGRPITGAGNHWGILFTSRFAARTTGVPLAIPLYPTQIYDSAAALVICIVLLALLAPPHKDGDVAGAWLFLFGLARFFLEFYRGDPGRGSFFDGACTGVQLVAAGMVVCGGVLWSVSQNQIIRQPADAS